MLNIRLRRLGRALAVALALAAVPAAADPPHARAAAAAAGTAERAFRDWRLACGEAGCSVGSALTAADGSEVLVLTAAGGVGAEALALRTPLPLFLPDGLTIGLGDAPTRKVAWRTCDAAGCEAVTPLDPALLAALKRERAAEVTLTLRDGVRVRLPVSLLGFTAAWEALAARSLAAGPGPEAAPAAINPP